MNKLGKLTSIAMVVGLVSACGNAEQTVAPKTEAEKQSYAIGASMGRYLNDNLAKNQEIGIELNKDMILGGIQDALNDKIQLTDDDIQQVMMALESQVREKRQAQQESLSKQAVEQGISFLNENAQREGVVVTDSGLQYEVITAAEGAKPAATDAVTVHYRGTLIDGTEFDSSYSRNQPATFGLNQVIKGWTEGLQYMTVGSKYKFYIPSNLAYGERSAGQIPANSTLIFEVELLSIGQ